MSSSALFLLFFLTLAAGPPDKVLMTRDEALELAFPKCEVTRSTKYLTKEQQKAVAKLAGGTFQSGVVYPYVATKEGKLVGTAYFDSHRVRTLNEAVMVVVAPDATIQRVEVLSFGEPREYLPRDLWYDQFKGRPLDDDLSLKRKIRSVTGATLTATATTACARRVLALHQTLAKIAKEKKAPSGGRPH